jgi:hypothetical protein
MSPQAVRSLAHAANKILSPLGVRVTRSGHDWSDPRQFLPFAATLSAARAAGLSVSDYVDVTYNVAGATQATIDEMDKLGVFSRPRRTVLEIGPGTGRYLEKVIRKCSPERYEIYETAEGWAHYLESRYGVLRRPCTGSDLSSTPDGSIDLVQAHKVFVCTPFLISCRYFLEMLRVAKRNADVVFDIVTERCMDDDTLGLWIADAPNHGNYPAIFPREFAIRFFEERQAEFTGSFFVPMRPGRTEVLVFRKSAD